MGFAVLYVLLGDCFKVDGCVRGLGALEAMYFSAVTITTLGYGDITPGCSLAQATVLAELAVGIYFLALIVAIVAGWATEKGQ